jgi:protein tyrosine phosphatase
LQYWPSKETSEYDSVLITLQEEEKMEEYAVRKFNLTSKQSSTERVITQFIYLAWSDGKVPETCSQLLEMINRIESEQQQVDNKSLVVTCRLVYLCNACEVVPLSCFVVVMECINLDYFVL